MNSKMKHSEALKHKKARYEKYKLEGRRELNKARKQAKIAKRLAKAAEKRVQ